MQLHEKIKDVDKKRVQNRQLMDDTNNQYQALKKNIKDFIRSQNTDKKKK